MNPAWPASTSNAATLLRAFDWSTTSIGAIQGWSQSLRTAVDIVLDSPTPMVLMWGPDHVLIYNDGYAPIAGARHPGMLGVPVQVAWPEIWDWNRTILGAGLRGKVQRFDEQRMVVQRNGTPEEIWFDLAYTPIRDEFARVRGVLCTVSDATARVRVRQERETASMALQRSNRVLGLEREAARDDNRRLLDETEILRGLFEQAPSFMAVVRGPKHVFELANEPFLRIARKRDVLNRPIADVLPELREQGFFELMDEVFRSGKPFVGHHLPVSVMDETGTMLDRVVDFVYQPILGADGSVSAIFIEGNDVTESAQAAERLHIAQKAGGIGTFEWFPDTGKLVVSDEYRRIWGLPPDVDVTDSMLMGIVVPEDRHITGPERIAGETNPLTYGEYRVVRPDDGRTRWIARRGEVVPHSRLQAPRFVGAAFDITQMKEIEEALRNTNERLRALFDQAAVGIVQADLNGIITQVNGRYSEMLGRAPAELVGQRLVELTHERDRERNRQLFESMLETGAPFLIDKRYLRPDGSEIWVSKHMSMARDAQGRHDFVSAVVVDITERRCAEEALRGLNEKLEQMVTLEVAERSRTEEALRQSQKMEAVGQLTGGIAHDFNNLLQGIIGSLELVQSLMARGRSADIPRFVGTAMASANRAAALTHRLLAFSRRQPLDPKPLRANQLVASMEDLLRRSLGMGVQMELVLSGGLWVTRCDGNQLENAILNLAINARDAMPDGGKLTIETCNAHLDNAYAAQQRDVTPGQYVCICVTDTGTGMSPEVVGRAFDPFFTTKPTGHGTGLGLSMIYGFARQSEGYAKIYSEVGKGTTVKLYLPRFRGETEFEDSLPQLGLDHRTQEGELVLVVEDEPVVRDLVIEVLHELGYRTLEAADGPSALKLLDAAPHIDLLVTDIGLPGLNGRQVADAARVNRPNLKVLFMTGYAENAAVANGFLEPGMQMITKPFALEALATRVREMIIDSPTISRWPSR